jgi:hypothetical protein
LWGGTGASEARRFQFEARDALFLVKMKECPPTTKKYAICGRRVVKFFFGWDLFYHMKSHGTRTVGCVF